MTLKFEADRLKKKLMKCLKKYEKSESVPLYNEIVKLKALISQYLTLQSAYDGNMAAITSLSKTSPRPPQIYNFEELRTLEVQDEKEYYPYYEKMKMTPQSIPLDDDGGGIDLEKLMIESSEQKRSPKECELLMDMNRQYKLSKGEGDKTPNINISFVEDVKHLTKSFFEKVENEKLEKLEDDTKNDVDS